MKAKFECKEEERPVGHLALELLLVARYSDDPLIVHRSESSRKEAVNLLSKKGLVNRVHKQNYMEFYKITDRGKQISDLVYSSFDVNLKSCD